VQHSVVLGEYTADFLLGNTPRRARLIVHAVEKPQLQIYRSAFVISWHSPPSPHFTPHFSQAKGWVKLEEQPFATYLVLKDLGSFCLVTHGSRNGQAASQGRPAPPA